MESLSQPLSTLSRRSLPFGSLAFLGAGASMLVCYSKAILFTAIAAVGLNAEAPELNPHLQAVLMWALGALAVYGLAQDRKIHHRTWPLVLGIVGVAVIIITLYTYYSTGIETSGYVLLGVAAFANQNIMLRQMHRQVENLNSSLELRVKEQVAENQRLARLKRFLPLQIANLVTEEKEKSLLQSHRSNIATFFCDLRGFTTFSESMEPEEVMDALQRYHEAVGQLVSHYGGTIDHRAGDGLMVFFNDPLPCDDPVLRAVELAVSVRQSFDDMNQDWAKRGYDLGLGIGIASGYATLGVVGFEGRFDYTANGNVVNLASRLCGEAEGGQILISHKAYIEVEDRVEAETIGEILLKGFSRPILVYNIRALVD
jgi:class 3 adenylate cyclase